MKNLLLTALLVLVPAVSFAQSVPYGGQGPTVDATRYRGIDAKSFGLKDAFGEVADDSVWGISALADFDSSVTFDALTWDNIFIQVRFIGGGETFAATDTVTAAGRDSNNVRIYHMGSIDGLTWTRVDSTSITDTLVNYDVVAWPGWPWYKAVIRGLAKIRGLAGSPGAVGRVRFCGKGAK